MSCRRILRRTAWNCGAAAVRGGYAFLTVRFEDNPSGILHSAGAYFSHRVNSAGMGKGKRNENSGDDQRAGCHAITYRGGDSLFLLRPTCISVLPEDFAARVGALVTVFKKPAGAGDPVPQFVCQQYYLEARIGEEENPYIADLLEKDKAHLGSVQLQTATAREFVLAVRLAVREKENPYLARVEKLIRDQGFDVRRADLDDVKRLMAGLHKRTL